MRPCRREVNGKRGTSDTGVDSYFGGLAFSLVDPEIVFVQRRRDGRQVMIFRCRQIAGAFADRAA